MPIDILVTEKEINDRIREIASEIERDFAGEDEITVVGVLKGSFMFMADLVRCIKIPLRCDFLRVASYEHNHSTGMVRMEFDLTQPVAGKSVLIIEDIVDTGNTLKFLLEHMHSKKPKKLKVASLLYKDVGKARHLVDYVGFEVPEKFVVGYGLDDEGLLRSLPYIGVKR